MEQRPAELIERLQMQSHPEGGRYAEVFRSPRRVRSGESERSAVTVIHFLLTTGESSRWHVVSSDEIWHFHEGDPLELVTFDPVTGRVESNLIGHGGEGQPTFVVPAGIWQACRACGAYSLVSCTVAPGFEFSDFRLIADLPGHEAVFESALSRYASLL
jgi:hypothetical protein